MKLETTIPHKFGTKVLVKGQTVEIDADGVADVDEEIAEVLLQNTSWSPFDPAAKASAGHHCLRKAA